MWLRVAYNQTGCTPRPSRVPELLADRDSFLLGVIQYGELNGIQVGRPLMIIIEARCRLDVRPGEA